MAKDRTTVQSPDPGIGTPPRDPNRSLDILQIELAKIQVDGDYTKKFLAELQTHANDMSRRMTTLEVNVQHLPSKGFIIAVVTSALVIFGAVITIAPHLQGFFRAPQQISSVPNQTPAK